MASHNDIVSEFFEIDKTLFLKNDEWSGLVKVNFFSLDEANTLKIVVTNTNVDNVVTNKEHLCSPSNPVIVWIPEYAPEYGQAAKVLLEESIERITATTQLSPFKQDFLSVN